MLSVLLDVKGLEILVETVREPVNKPDDGDKDQCDCDLRKNCCYRPDLRCLHYGSPP